MADALISLVLDRVTSLIQSEIDQEVKLVVGVKKELERLTSNLQAIHCVLADAEEKQLKQTAVKNWLNELKDVAFDMEDVLDEWNTARLKLQIEGGSNSASKPSKRRVLSIIPFSCFRCREVGLRHDIARKIKDLNEMMDHIKNQKHMFHFEVGKGMVIQPEPQITISSIDTSYVQSREQERTRVKNLLLSESSHGSAIHTVSILGMGGIGKTTLAQLAFNDDEVKAHFDKTIWVCASKPYDSLRLAKAILESLSGDAQRCDELQTMVTRIE